MTKNYKKEVRKIIANKEPFISIEGVLWDVREGVMSVREGLAEIMYHYLKKK